MATILYVRTVVHRCCHPERPYNAIDYYSTSLFNTHHGLDGIQTTEDCHWQHFGERTMGNHGESFQRIL